VDYQLLALVAIMTATLAVAIRQRMWWGPGGSTNSYQAVISTAAAGLLFFVSGTIGWDLSNSRGFFKGTRWVDGPIWWQMGLGAALLLLATVWARRITPPKARGRRDVPRVDATRPT
jgi:hypothetical protein